MRLVGASKMVIQLPFILEGVLSKQYPDTAFISPGQTLILVPALIGLGVVLAGISSLLTLRRYLRV